MGVTRFRRNTSYAIHAIEERVMMNAFALLVGIVLAGISVNAADPRLRGLSPFEFLAPACGSQPAAAEAPASLSRSVCAEPPAAAGRHGRAMIRRGPPEPPAIFMGSAITTAASVGSVMMSATFSKMRTFPEQSAT